jgi:hypothetical protein
LRLAFACALIALAACTPELDWRELSLPDSRFSVLLPCKPQRETRTLNTAAGALRMTMYACSLAHGTMAVAYTDVAANALTAAQTDAQVDAARDALLRNIGAGARTEEEANIAGLPGRQISAEGRSGAQALLLKARFVVAGSRIYQIAYVGARDALDMADIDLFLASFRPLS